MTMHPRTLAAALLCSAVVSAQQDVFEQLALRVSSLRPDGKFVVDRGSRDLVQVGDRVVLTPRNGQSLNARVVEVDERTALVEFVNPNDTVPIGTRGQVALPRSRRAAAPAPAGDPTRLVPPPLPPEKRQPEAKTDEWQPGQPLLGVTRPPRPEERPSTMNGRMYASTSLVRTLDSWNHSYLTLGTDFDIDNLGGRGGILHFHGDFNWSRETSEQTGQDLRLYELSYEEGGTRHRPLFWQVGRFLLRDMPEFGILDGVAVGKRTEGGDRVGASLGYLPELDEDMESFADLQVSAWYLWNQDVAERLSFGVGYQKTWHRFEVDRDLLVGKFRYLPLSGWLLQGTVFVDLYTGRDTQKDQSFEITRGNAFLSRRWDKEGGVELFYDHEEYPEIRRRELPQQIQPQTLIDARQDRVSLHAFVFGGETRWFTRLTGWHDEEDSGGSLELGVEFPGLAGKNARTTLAGYQMNGSFSSLFGGRLQHGGTFGFGRLDVLYELAFVHQESFPDERDDLLQHRLAGLLTTDLGAGWNAIFTGDATIWDDELSFGLSLYLQKNF